MPSTSALLDRIARWLIPSLLLFLLIERVLLALLYPDLVHDLDPGELRHLDLALHGLPDGPSLKQRLYTWLSGTENIHHGGFPILSVLFLLCSKITGTSLFVLRLVGPILATLLAAICLTRVLQRHCSPWTSALMLLLFAGAPPLLLKWTCTARGGHLEAILFPCLLLLLLDRALERRSLHLWLLAGVSAGLGSYVSYLAAPSAAILGLSALAVARSEQPIARPLSALTFGSLLGFMPWILGWLVLELPYLEAPIHSSANPAEAREVHGRSLMTALVAGFSALPQNLWPWTLLKADALAYAAAEPDIFDYSVTGREWITRLAINFSLLLGIISSLRKRAFLLAAFLLLPALHHLFVLRAANQPGWPLIPHRYLILVFPAIVAGAALGATSLLNHQLTSMRRLGALLSGSLVLISMAGILSHIQLLQQPVDRQPADFRADLYRRANIGQVRSSDAQQVASLAAGNDPTWQQERWQGLARVYPPISDYYLLFRENPLDRPYPGELFNDPEMADSTQAVVEARALEIEVETAFAATELRAGTDRQLRDRWLCSWKPSERFRKTVRKTLLEQLPSLHCGKQSALHGLLNTTADPAAQPQQLDRPATGIKPGEQPNN